MPALENLTRFAAIDLLSADHAGVEQLVVCASGRFKLPPAGITREQPLALTEEQPLPPLRDEYWGAPGASSLKLENQATWFRPATDIYISATAFPPLGQRVTSTEVRIQVGLLRHTALVFGSRVWQRSATGSLRPTDPARLAPTPLRFENAFGGIARDGDDTKAAFEPRNPLGCGFYRSVRDALDQPLPSIENPKALIRTPEDRPAPVGFGPMPRTFAPRRALAGTFDAQWKEERAPLWPLDFNPRFFCAASPGLVAEPYLHGGEPVVLLGLSPEGTIAFPLPAHRLVARAVFRTRSEERPLALDGVHLDAERGFATLFWRASFPVHGELESHRNTVLRVLDPGEETL